MEAAQARGDNVANTVAAILNNLASLLGEARIAIKYRRVNCYKGRDGYLAGCRVHVSTAFARSRCVQIVEVKRGDEIAAVIILPAPEPYCEGR